MKGVIDKVLEQRGLKMDPKIYDNAKEMRKICLENASKKDTVHELVAAKMCEKNYAIDGMNILVDEKTNYHGYQLPGVRNNGDVNYTTEAYIDHSDENITSENPPHIEVPESENSYDICLPYDNRIDENTTDENIIHWEKQETGCDIDYQIDPNQNTNVAYDNNVSEQDNIDHNVDNSTILREEDNNVSKEE